MTDTGGIDDSFGRSDKFSDQLAESLRKRGAHGFVYVHDACSHRLSASKKDHLKYILDTVATKTRDLNPHLAILFTNCFDKPRQFLYGKAIPEFLCEQLELCNFPMFWFDDFNTTEASSVFQCRDNVCHRPVHPQRPSARPHGERVRRGDPRAPERVWREGEGGLAGQVRRVGAQSAPPRVPDAE